MNVFSRIRRRDAGQSARQGIITPFLAISISMLCAFTALAVDLGMLAVAQTQCQNAADAAATAAARSLTGNTGSNLSGASTSAQNAAIANLILGTALTTSEITIQHGAYHYDTSSQTFAPQFPPTAPDTYNLSQVTIQHSVPTMFAQVIGINSFSVNVTATAAHRPRDVAIVLDFSGSMNNESDVWNCESYLGSMNNSPNNTDPAFPQFGVYDLACSPLATLQCTSGDPRVGKCNITQSVLGVPAMINDFYSNSKGSGAASAFSPAPGSVTNTTPGGDKYLKDSSGTRWALTWKDITGSGATKFNGYAAASGSFSGYTQGPGYWGKTFFIWPPDPNAASDWRKKFFKTSLGLPCADNRCLWDSGGNWQDPSGNYIINYAAILAWIKSGPSVFPTQLRAGNVLYYDAIPDDVPLTAYVHSVSNSTISNVNQRFWKEYIDFVIGVWRDPFGNIQDPGSPSCSYGPDFQAGTGQGGSSNVKISGPDAATTGGQIWIDKDDNPLRPRHRFWFGPLTMIQFMMDTGLLPGTSHDISCVVAKLGVTGALMDIQTNHPNDLVSLILYSRPNYSGEPSEAGNFSNPVVVSSSNYTALINALWYPPNSSGADVRPWDANCMMTPSAHGDYCSNTATSYGLMLAYNTFSSSAALRAAGVGGYGRKGASKLVILETDGMANASTNASISNGGSYNSYYSVGSMGTYSASGADPATDSVNVANNICAMDTASTPGYSTVSKPVQIQCIVFGAIFEPSASGSTQSSAVSLMQQISTAGGTVFPSSSSDPTDGYKWCIGTLSARQSLLQQAFTKAMDSGVSIILVK